MIERLGLNRTGIAVSPSLAQAAEEVGTLFHLLPGPSLLEQRKTLLKDAESIGAVAMPNTLKGLTKVTLETLKGNQPTVLLDKLGERLAFERTSVRLYDLTINKCEARSREAVGLDLDVLRRIRADELAHFQLIVQALQSLGADATAVTPSGDVAGMASAGFVQVLSDPRTTVADALQILKIAELADNDGWQVLLELVADLDQESLYKAISEASEQEQRHVEEIGALHRSTVLLQ